MYFTEKQVKDLKASEVIKDFEQPGSNYAGLLVGLVFIMGVLGALFLGSEPVENETAVFPTEIIITQVQPTGRALLPTPTLKPTITAEPTLTETAVPSATATPTATYTPLPTETAVPTNTPLPTATATTQPTITPLFNGATVTPLPTPAPTEKRPFNLQAIGTAVSVVPLVLSGVAVLVAMWGKKTAVPVIVAAPAPLLHDGQQKRPLLLRPIETRFRGELQPVTPVQPVLTQLQPVATPQITIPLDRSRPPNEQEREYIKRRYQELGSLTAVCFDVYGVKSGGPNGTFTFVKSAVFAQ